MGDRSPRSSLVLALTAVAVVGGGFAAWLTNRPAAVSGTMAGGLEAATAESAAAESAPAETATAETGGVPAAAGAGTPAATSGEAVEPGEPGAGSAGPEVAVAEPAEPQPEAARAPGFDVVRVEPDGQAAVVGTAEPGSKVTVFADSAPVAEAEADAQGNFVALFSVEPSAEPRALTLGSEGPGGDEAASKDAVMLLPQAPPAADAGPTEAASASGEATPEAAPTVAATAIVREEGVDILPPAGDPTAPRAVTLGSISYGATGGVRLAGVGTAGSVVRIYVDDRFVREVRVAGDGRWQAGLEDVVQGLYRLRIDQLAPDGAVASRVETPFQRDLPPPPRPRPDGSMEAIVAGPGGEAQLTVQPGNNLWTLARTRYGAGTEYTRIYTANRDLIRDPDLIYPGQIFRMPE